jgi:diguanylate cyclase (GGDEF)-like protein
VGTPRSQHGRWLIEFGLVSLALIGTVGLALGQTVVGNMRERAVASGLDEAQGLSRVGVEPILAQPELGRTLSGRQRSMLERVLRPGSSEERALQVTIRNRALRVLYSSERGRAGRAPATRELKTALRGTAVASVAEGGDRHRAALRSYVPLRSARSRRPTGVIEVHAPYAPIDLALRHDTRHVYLVLVGALGLLWALLLGVVASASNKLRRQVGEKQQEALRDSLTGLANRALFLTMAQRVISARGRKNTLAAVMIMDLDRFKEVNDTLGHHSGDLLLKRVASRLQEVVRGNETLARLGGDEFAILVPDILERQDVVPLAKRILQRFEEPVVIGGLTLRVEASFGIAVSPDHGDQVDTLMQAADVAMYAAKAERSGYKVFDPALQRNDPVQLALVGELRRAIDEGELVLHYQPKVELRTGAVTSVEAVARWQHPRRGLLMPDAFIPLAEHSHVLKAMTLHLLDTAVKQSSAWRAQGHELRIAVNLSMQNLLDIELPNDLDRLLKSRWLASDSLELEITESAVMTDPARTLAILTRLNDMGFGLTIDDFGTGYSSLAYLKELPVSTIKIDKSFVLTMAENEGNATIVRSTIDLGHNLGLEVVAEGVETEGVVAELTALGCDLAQGYVYTKPVPADELIEWLEALSRRPKPVAPARA